MKVLVTGGAGFIGSNVADGLIEEGYETLSLPLPALLTVVKEISYPRLPTLRGKQKAKKTDLPIWTTDNIPVDTAQLGLKGSPTRVVKISRPKVTRNGTFVKATDEESAANAVDQLIDFLRKKQLI